MKKTLLMLSLLIVLSVAFLLPVSANTDEQVQTVSENISEEDTTEQKIPIRTVVEFIIIMVIFGATVIFLAYYSYGGFIF